MSHLVRVARRLVLVVPIALALAPATAHAAGELAINPDEADFGVVIAGEQRSLPLTVANIGTDPVVLGDFWLLHEDGAPVEAFSVDVGSCADVDMLEAGADCQMTATFSAPQQDGSFEALVMIEGEGVDPALALLSGRSVLPPPQQGKLLAEPASVGFRRTQIGAVSPARQVRVRNSGTGPIALPPAAANNPHFGIVGNGCPPVLAAGAECSISVIFKPIDGPPLPVGYLVGEVTQRGTLVFGDRNPATNKFALAVALSGNVAQRLNVGKIKADLAAVAGSVPRALRGGPRDASLAAFITPEVGALSARVYGWVGKRRVLVAKGSERFFWKERHRLYVSLTRQGRKMLRQPKRTRVRAVLAFTTTDGIAVRSERAFKVKAPNAKRPAKAKRKRR